MKFITLFLFSMLLCADSSFITPMEYASSLYKNPRGIGCQYCHGDKGEGKLVATYSHKGIEKEFHPPKINDLGFKKFYKALNVRKKGMPRYFLTTNEIKALYLYLHKKEKK